MSGARQGQVEEERRWQDGLPHGKGIWEAFSYSDVQLLLPSLQLDAFATFVTVPDFTGWMLRPRLALKAPCSMTSYCGFLQPATHPLPCWTSHPFPHPRGFGCALMQLLLPWSKRCCVSLPLSHPLSKSITWYVKAKVFSCHLSTCNVHFCPLLCEKLRESWILYCCQHPGLAQICHLAEVSLL